MQVQVRDILDRYENGLEVTVRLDGETHRRVLRSMDDQDVADLRIAGMFWRHGDRAAEMGHPDAALTEHCLAIERLFPHLRERLPA